MRRTGHRRCRLSRRHSRGRGNGARRRRLGATDGRAVLHGARPECGRGRGGARAVVITCAGRAEGDLVAVLEHRFAADALSVDVRSVQAAEIAKDETAVALFYDAMLLRNDFIEELDRVVRVPPEAIDWAELNRLLSFGGCEDQLCHARVVHASAARFVGTDPPRGAPGETSAKDL